MSLGPMKFGTEKEFEIALTELRWIEKTKGRISEEDVRIIAEKYSFPIDFLKEGLKGLEFPRDYIISQSKWFPIIYLWNKHFRALHYEYFRVTTNYVRWGGAFLAVVIVVPSLGVIFGEMILGFGFPLQSVVLWVATPTLTLTISISLWFASKRGEAKSRWEQFKSEFESEVPNRDIFLRTVSMTNRFIGKNTLLAMALARKQEADFVHMNLFRVGDIELPKQKKASRFWGTHPLLSLLRLRKHNPTVETVPIYFGENPDLEYSKRMKTLRDSTR